ncbi:hypothetical protein H8356DRAFT_1331115 [Neocallimastix lanati (nom. inval.)]|nr:hypothetical protein H8356DRAFT_1331115 [Neocallimastix sp. JGI-2020a]
MKLFLPYVDRLYIITTNDTFTISNLENALIDRIPVIPSAKRFSVDVKMIRHKSYEKF